MIQSAFQFHHPSGKAQRPAFRSSASETCGFTLIELLVVISIIAILAGLIFPAFTAAQINSNKTASMSNMRQLSAGLINYAAQNDGEIPPEGESNPTWVSSTAASYGTAWYNSVPRMAGSKGLADFAKDQADFYSPQNLTFVRAAKYPTTKSTAPLFAISMNSKLHDTTLISNDATVRLQNFQSPATTMIFQEAGVSGDTILTGQTKSNYDGQSKSFASRTVARYNGYTLMIMADGHVASFVGTDVVTTAGKAYNPQSLGKVYWTMDPTLNANN
jgi:prepilin-type N-terminal cleavage/methylation domain-containing protein